jgi:hypothetical protein
MAIYGFGMKPITILFIKRMFMLNIFNKKVRTLSWIWTSPIESFDKNVNYIGP